MNSTLATELTERPETKSLLETWGKNERMRHVPPMDWIVEKLDIDLRQRIEKLYAPFAALNANDPRLSAIEAEFRALFRRIDRLGETAKFTRGNNHAPAEVGARIDWSITRAVSCLNSLDRTLFGRRYPFQTLERSRAEPLYGALLVVIDHVHRLTNMIRAIDPSIDQTLLERVVSLEEPLWDGHQPVTTG